MLLLLLLLLLQWRSMPLHEILKASLPLHGENLTLIHLTSNFNSNANTCDVRGFHFILDFCRMKRLRVLLLPLLQDGSPLRGYLSSMQLVYIQIQTTWTEVSCLRKQRYDSTKIRNANLPIWSPKSHKLHVDK